MRNRQAEFLKILDAHDHRQSSRQVFERFLEMAYCALAKPLDREPEKREARYMALVGALEPARAQQFAEMLGILALGIHENEGRDFLGPVVSEREFLNAHIGQFFTPWDVCSLMVHMTITDALDVIKDRRFLTIAEPACGAGAMMLAAAQHLRAQGVDVARDVWFEGTDLADFCARMAFVQMALTECSGIIRCQNSLTMEPAYDVAVLPMSSAFVARHGHPFAERAPRAPQPQIGQLALI